MYIFTFIYLFCIWTNTTIQYAHTILRKPKKKCPGHTLPQNLIFFIFINRIM